MSRKIADIIISVRPEINFESGEDTNLFGALDSLDIILIVDEIEKELGISIPSEHISPETFTSVRTLEAFIKKFTR